MTRIGVATLEPIARRLARELPTLDLEKARRWQDPREGSWADWFWGCGLPWKQTPLRWEREPFQMCLGHPGVLWVEGDENITVRMPRVSRVEAIPGSHEWTAILFHEAAHWVRMSSGWPKAELVLGCLDSENYAREEVIAELASKLLCDTMFPGWEGEFWLDYVAAYLAVYLLEEGDYRMNLGELLLEARDRAEQILDYGPSFRGT